MDFQLYTFPVPSGATTFNLDALHTDLEAAKVGLDGVSVQGDSILIYASSDPTSAFDAINWTPVLAQVVDPLTAKLTEITSALSVALTGTDAQKTDAAAQLASTTP